MRSSSCTTKRTLYRPQILNFLNYPFSHIIFLRERRQRRGICRFAEDDDFDDENDERQFQVEIF